MPIVFCAADTEYVAGRSLPSNVTGVDAKRDFARTLEVMQTIDPDLRHVTLVVGAGSMDRAWEAYPQSELQTHSSKVEFTWLRGLPLPELTRAVGSLPPGSAVLYLVQFADMYGTPYVPRAVAAAVSEAASAPVYGTWGTLIGSGITGGWLATMEEASIVAGSAPMTTRPDAPHEFKAGLIASALVMLAGFIGVAELAARWPALRRWTRLQSPAAA